MAAALALAGAAGASATVRYAGPGGTGADPCADPAAPCSIFTAVDREASGSTLAAGDEIVLAPGQYSDTAGDLGPAGVITLELAVDVHGEVGAPRPVITLNQDSEFGGIIVLDKVRLAHLEIDSAVAQANIAIVGGAVDDLIARNSSSAPGVFACLNFEGLLSNSVCLSSGSQASAVGSSETIGGSTTTRVTLRNLTAIATGNESTAIEYEVRSVIGNPRFEIDAKSVLARGTRTDIVAAGLTARPQVPASAATVTIALDHSDYVTTSEVTDVGGGIATVSEAGEGTNITAAPLLAADGFHQLAGSPTEDAGAVDGFSGDVDIDGDQRVVGVAADIGADEFVLGSPGPPVDPGPPSKPTEGDGPGGAASVGPTAGPSPPIALETRITDEPARRTARRLARFRFASIPGGSRFQCQLDRQPLFTPCGPSFKRRLAPGRHVLRVRAVDPSGAVDPTPARYRWKILP